MLYFFFVALVVQVCVRVLALLFNPVGRFIFSAAYMVLLIYLWKTGVLPGVAFAYLIAAGFLIRLIRACFEDRGYI